MRRLGSLAACVVLAAGCRGGNLTNIGASLKFSSPDDPSAVSQPDLADVDIDFGAVGLGATKTLTLQLASQNGAITLGALTAAQPDDEFDLPLVPGTSVGVAGQQVVASFRPTALGSRVAVYTLATDSVVQEIVRFRVSGEGVPQALVVDPDPIAFGNVELNQVSMVPVTITNHGETPALLTLSPLGGANPEVFTLDPLPSTSLAVGASMTFESHFGPRTAGAASASFELTGCSGCGALSVPLLGAGVTSVLQAAPDPVHFGFVLPGSSAIQSLVITNGGTQALHLLSPGPAFASSGAAAGFSFGPPLATTPVGYPFALAPGQTAVIPIAFVPPRLGFFTSSVSFPTDDPGAPQLAVSLDGYGGGAQISCVPSAVAFGPVAVGQNLRLPVFCTNVGIDVPNHPEAGLLLTEGGLSTDSPRFTAALAVDPSVTAPDGGGVLLGAGQNAEIDVTYAATAVESDTATLTIASNDSQKPALAVALSGQGVQPGACRIQVTPSQVTFGEVPEGGRAVRQVEISNASTAYCAVTDIALDPGSDPAFGLPAGPVSYGLLGYPGNPEGAPTSLRVGVAFAPQTSQSQATGRLDFSAGGSAATPVPLTGSSASACLRIAPGSYDFGRVGFDSASMKSCVDATANLTVQNVCSHPVTVSALEIDSGLDILPQFSLLGSPALPLQIVPAGQLTLSAGFAPSSVGPKAGTIAITTDEGLAPYEVSLLGDAESSGARTDTFTAQQNKVDLVFIIDDDDDLTEIAAVAQELPGFIQAANDAQLDYRIAVTSTDLCNATPSDQGSFEPCSHCTAAGSPDPTYFTRQTPNAAQALSDLFLLHADTACIPKLVGDEFFFGSIQAIFQPALLASHNAGFLRDDAYLALVVLNGDGEDDRSIITPQGIANFVQGLKPDPRRVSVSYIDDSITALSQAPRVQTLVLATGGVLIDTSTRWLPGFFDLFWATQRLGGFSLGTSPDPSTLLVEENGVPFAAQSNGATIWSYDSVKNAVVFTPQNIPVPGTVITIGYTLACD